MGFVALLGYQHNKRASERTREREPKEMFKEIMLKENYSNDSRNRKNVFEIIFNQITRILILNVHKIA